MDRRWKNMVKGEGVYETNMSKAKNKKQKEEEEEEKKQKEGQ